jgi:Na+/proline symporter
MVQKGMIQLESPDHALPTLIAAVLPIGIKGLVVAGLLAALMSSLSSVLTLVQLSSHMISISVKIQMLVKPL